MPCRYLHQECSAIDALQEQVTELKATLSGHTIVAGEVKVLTEALEKCLEMEGVLPPATVRQAKESLDLRQKILKVIGST